MQQLDRTLRQMTQIVNHGLQEIQAGAPLDHALREVALMGALVGRGMPPTQAIQTVERFEAQLLSMGAWERTEPQFHPGFGQQPGGYPTPYGGAPGPMYGAPGMYGQQMPGGMNWTP